MRRNMEAGCAAGAVECCPRRARSDAGFTFVEVVVGIVILGVVTVAVFTGLATTIVGVDRHRDHSSGSTVLVEGLEHVKAQPWASCAGAVSAYTPADVTRDGLTWSYSLSVDSSDDGAYVGGCSDADPLQRVSLTIAAPGSDTTLSAEVVKRDE